MTELAKIANQGQRIVSTNYWDTEQARAGFLFLSWNAGAARLLVPDVQKPALKEMRTAKYVIISRGPWQGDEGQGRDAMELLFEDGTDSPYSLQLLAEQCDRLVPDSDQGAGFVVAVWTRGGEKLRLPGKYRRVASIPCLQEWVDH